MSAPAPSPLVISDELRIGISIEYMLVALIGGILNILIFTALVEKFKKSSHTDFKLSMVVVATDIFVSSGLFIRSIIGLLPYHLLEISKEWCTFDLIYTAQLLVFSGYALAVMSLERFFLICLDIQLSFYFWFVLILLSWIPQTLYLISAVAIQNNFIVVGRTKTACTAGAAGIGYGLFVMVLTLFFLSFACVIVGYVGIMVVKIRQTLNQLKMNVPKDRVYNDLRSTIIKSIVYISVFIAVFSGKLFIIVYELFIGKKRTIEMDAISNCLVSCSVIANPLVLLYMHSEAREGFVSFMKSLKKTILG
jgi:hypothetical protein